MKTSPRKPVPQRSTYTGRHPELSRKEKSRKKKKKRERERGNHQSFVIPTSITKETTFITEQKKNEKRKPDTS
jgi:hypothetical protein